MKKLMTLIEIEIKKILLLLFITFGLMTLASSLLFYSSANVLHADVIRELAGSSVAEYVESIGKISLGQAIGVSYNFHFFIFGASAVFLVASSTFYLWYKEWFGQSKRIYLLFSLRGSRFTILVSKLLTILGATFIFYGMILVNLLIGELILRVVLPDGVVATGGIKSVISHASTWGLGFSLPLSFGDFLYKIVFVTLAVSGISTWVLMDRSKKIWGFLLGFIYCIFIASMYIRTQLMFLFFDERFLVDWGFAIGASALSLMICFVLLNKKVSI